MTIEMEQVNYRSGVDYILVLKDARGNDIGWPDYDWSAKVYTRRRMCAVEVSCRGGVPVNCWNDNGRVHVTLKDHRLEPGVMTIEFTAELPDGHFPDGSKPVAVPVEVGLELVRGAAPCPKQMQIELVLPYIKGDPLTWEDLTPEQMAELQRPAKEAADAFAPFAREAKESEATRVANEKTRVAQETARTDAEAERAKAEKLRASAEESRAEAERGRVTAEEARVSAEQKRATEFAGFEKTIEEKQDKLDTTEGLSLEDGVLSLTDRAKQRLFDDMWKAAVGLTGDVDHSHYDEDGRHTPYMANRLWLTYEEAIAVCSQPRSFSNPFCIQGARTNIRPFGYANITTTQSSLAFVGSMIEVANICAYDHKIVTEFDPSFSLSIKSTYLHAFFNNCTRLHTVIGSVSLAENGYDNINLCPGCVSLVHIPISNLHQNLCLGDCPLLSIESLSFLIANANNGTKAITVTVHLDVYAKLADPENMEWHKVLTDALEKNISFATV